MDFTVLYTSSPDWIKALMVILPHGTLLGMVWLIARRPRGVLPPLVPAAPLQGPSRPPVMNLLPPAREPHDPEGDALDLVLEDRERTARER